ncbi:hypothetical protein LTR37_007825 [Vermiconidia calcicola]|uniref:Uncharacterized protein n=1 Tax=Vermiconidia calcicola TaxID=1690605 RepID=A0ACC3NCV4_9PEZI|nr:hypothetical protein LTR37_007825 [Vermiconidia calcicola]
MVLLSFLTSALLASTALARRSPQHVNKKLPERNERRASAAHRNPQDKPNYGGPATKGPIIEQTVNNTKFKVDGKGIPFVDFNVGESYAGLLPISDEEDVSELFFWFFPSNNPQADDEILIWLNGGPGCSSFEGLLQENGPFLWQYGTYRPVQNPYTWNNLTNVVWVEQPAGTGFSQQKGTPPAKNEIEVAAQFLGFWQNFVDTFGLQGRKVVPYIADAMHNETDTEYYDIRGVLFYDPTTTYSVIEDQIPTVPFVDYWNPLFSFNDTYMDDIRQRADECGYTEFMETAMTFPPTGPLPLPPHVNGPKSGGKCDIWGEVISAAQAINPCWDIYQVATTCPLLWDVLGFPGSFEYEPAPWIYFNRTDVQKAINAPIGEWMECSGGVLETDNSPPSALSVLPRVIEKNDKTIIGHAMLDFILIVNGTIMMIQNMTWNGEQGFSTPPSEWNDFYVPYHSELNLGSIAGAGVFGQWWEERGLTFSTIDLAGHMVPQYAPSAAYRQVEYLLGRIESLGEVSDFTTQRGNFGNDESDD